MAGMERKTADHDSSSSSNSSNDEEAGSVGSDREEAMRGTPEQGRTGCVPRGVLAEALSKNGWLAEGLVQGTGNGMMAMYGGWGTPR